MRWILVFVLSLICFKIAAQQAKCYDIIITELLADPNPSNGLPEAEFIELKNNSGDSINLFNWIISDGNSRARINEKIILHADSFLIICSNAYKIEFESRGRVCSVSGFPSLDNQEDQLILFSADGRLIHGIQYAVDSFPDPLKTAGGWSLEMIDTKFPCSGSSNWNFSRAIEGGTPGKENSLARQNPDTGLPQIMYCFAEDSLHLVAVFNKSLDSASVVSSAVFNIDNGIGQPQQIWALEPAFSVIRILLARPVLPDKIYTIHYSDISDCYQKKTSQSLSVRTGLPGTDQDGLVINEVLFNPRPSGTDFVEFFNAGNSIIDASRIFIASRNSSGVISSPVACATKPALVFPGDYFVITGDAKILRNEFPAKLIEPISTIKNLPSFPDDKGSVILFFQSGDILDEFQYSDKLHFPLLANTEGVSLERIDPLEKTDDAGNWFSAAADAGYATPAELNSQFKRPQPGNSVFYTDIKTFSPDHDGFDDQLTISYRFAEPGSSCTITIFNPSGFPVKNLVRNQLCGTEGYFRWNGLGERNESLLTGIYYLVIEWFQLNGKRELIRKSVVLTGNK